MDNVLKNDIAKHEAKLRHTREAKDRIKDIELEVVGRLRIPDTFDAISMEQWKRKVAMYGMSVYEIDSLFDWVPVELSELQKLHCEGLVTTGMQGDIDIQPSTNDDADDSWESKMLAKLSGAFRAVTLEEWQGLEMRDFTMALRKLGRILQRHPVKRQSGKYEERVKTERTQQDLNNEMAKMLTDLPRYNAYRKLVAGERTQIHKIRTAQFAKGEFPAFCVLSEREAYYKSRDEVNREILQRLERNETQPKRNQPPPSSI